MTPYAGTYEKPRSRFEAFFSKMARMSLRGLRVSSKDELKEHIQSWLDECNADPVPFRWRWKMDEVHELINSVI